MNDKNLNANGYGEVSSDDLLANFTSLHLDEIRQRVLEGIAEADRSEYTEYAGRAGLKRLSEDIKRRGRERLLADQK